MGGTKEAFIHDLCRFAPHAAQHRPHSHHPRGKPDPAERAARYRADGLWDTRTLFDGIEAAATSRPDATALVDHLSRQLVASGLQCALQTRLTNPAAHALYERIGYEPISEVLAFRWES